MSYTITFEFVNSDGYPVLPSTRHIFSRPDTPDGPDISQVIYWIRSRYNNRDLLLFTSGNVLLSIKCQTLGAIVEVYDYEPSDLVLFVRPATPCEAHHLQMLNDLKERIIRLDGMVRDNEEKQAVALEHWKYVLERCLDNVAQSKDDSINFGTDHSLYDMVEHAHNKYLFTEEMTNKFKEKMEELWDEVILIEETYYNKTPEWDYSGKKRKL